MRKNIFFGEVRNTLFGGRLTNVQVSGMELIIDFAVRYGVVNEAQIAYILATAYHETGQTFAPILENLNYSEAGLLSTFPKYFNKVTAKSYARKPEAIANRAYANRMDNGPEASGDGWKYRGRGFAQLTGRRNYTLFGKKIGVDLVNKPDAALNQDKAAFILVIGMRDGLFTGKKLDNFIDRETKNFKAARAIVNGTDRQDDIAAYAEKFLRAVKAAA